MNLLAPLLYLPGQERCSHKALVQKQVSEVNLQQKVLETAHVELASVGTDVSFISFWMALFHLDPSSDLWTVKTGVRIIPCWLPTKSPWLNKIELGIWYTANGRLLIR